LCFCYGHCIARLSSICGFWLWLWYIPNFLMTNIIMLKS
jgi:hypothetical protein